MIEPTLSQPFQQPLDVRLANDGLSFIYGSDVRGPKPELRKLDEIRGSLRDPRSDGPETVYSIVMDVARKDDFKDLKSRLLLFGVVAYSSGRIGEEPVRSQGHIHSIAPHSGWSTPELFEVWQGKAIIYAQRSASDDPGPCVAIEASPGDQVVVPPGWAHCVINADPSQRMVFAALCERQYGFDYKDVRAHGGLAWFPLLHDDGVMWERNPRYNQSTLNVRGPRDYPELGLDSSLPIYEQYKRNPEGVQWVSDPARFAKIWKTFEP